MARFIVFISAVTVFAEFRAEVHGDPTIIGCYIRGLNGIEEARCGGAAEDFTPRVLTR